MNISTSKCILALLILVRQEVVKASFAGMASATANSQLQLDSQALQIAYETDFQKKVNPGLYLSQASDAILELYNSANFMMTNAKQWSAFSAAAYLCFAEPSTDGCEHFNDLGCEAINADCEAYGNQQKSHLSSLCTNTVSGKKTILNDCFIVSLREASDGASRDNVAPWNAAVQDWVDAHNCTSLMYHLKYRCVASLVKWDSVTASEKYVDLDKLFDATFGITSVSNFNGQDALECAALTQNDRDTLKEIAQLHVETAVLSFVTTATSLARLGLGAFDVVERSTTSHPQDKLRTTLMVNLFYDGFVQPFREFCCAENMCYDYHPMDVVTDKVHAFNTFYPGGLLSLAGKAQEFAGAPDVGKMHAGTGLPITSSDAYVFNVLRDAPSRAAWQATTGTMIGGIEDF